MHFDLNLAIAFVCFLGICCFVVTTLVPRLLGALVATASELLQTRRRMPGEPAARDDHGDWWGPTHHSQ